MPIHRQRGNPLNLTRDLIEHYYRTRLDGTRIHHSKDLLAFAMRDSWRRQPQLPESRYFNGPVQVLCMRSWGKNLSAFEQEMLKRERGVVPRVRDRQRIDFRDTWDSAARTHSPEVPAQAKGGWDRSKLKPGISMRTSWAKSSFPYGVFGTRWP